MSAACSTRSTQDEIEDQHERIGAVEKKNEDTGRVLTEILISLSEMKRDIHYIKTTVESKTNG